ncbi:MAG: hypothetical protein JO257_23890 [Deltaproteobacteria bacterium]|nr:hypothetical protein [Deltaproteobacteria bacterium]
MRDVLRLGALLACVALATSRFGLLAHELVGHGGTALAVGAHVVEVKLFWFAGGWIRNVGAPSTAAALAIAMGGIAVETVAGIGLQLVRGETLGRRIVRGIGLALVLHASWYLATGAFSGFGDGVLLYRELGGARVPVAIAAALVTCTAGYLGAREALGALAATQRRPIVGTALAVLLAAGLHAGLAVGELQLRRDRTYAETMAPERERQITAELARWQAAHPQAAEPERTAAAHSIAEAHRPTFPFTIVLAIATLVAIVAGARRAKPGAGPITRRLLVTWAVAAAIAIAIVIAV